VRVETASSQLEELHQHSDWLYLDDRPMV